MDAIIKAALNTVIFHRIGRGGGGCISEGEGYATDQGNVFVKRNSKREARQMFDGEYESLKAIHETATVRVPKPLVVLDNPGGGAVIVAEYLDMSSLSRHAARLGEQLARLHLHNGELRSKSEDEGGSRYVSRFGFPCATCCGSIPQDNTWCDDWVNFFANQKLQAQIDLLQSKGKDEELADLWPRLRAKMPEFFQGAEVTPSLLHGDLWSGNAAETSEGPVVFDPASFYGHSEFDLAIAKMFGGFGNAFFQAYHVVLPKAPGFDQRHQLYQLFHYLNHWQGISSRLLASNRPKIATIGNHFGSGYRGSSISIMKKLVSK